ncbi:MAG TPA: MFS transporter [Pseudonocardiaceae bacterium]|nr:MFS transporter [Pseudonocardiaceae bacterium]
MIDIQTEQRHRWRAMSLLAMTQFVVILDITIVNIALPTIKTSLGFNQADLQWVVDAYLLTFGGFLLLGGRAADLFGRRRVFMTGLALFGIASLACGLATTSGELIAARVVQGLGGALLSPAALSLVAVIFPEGAARNKAMGIWGAVAGAGGATGVVLGGILTNGPGWQWVFWVNVPFTLGGVLIAPLFLAKRSGAGARGQFDLLGAITVTLGLTALIYGLVELSELGIGSGRVLIALAAAVVLLAAFGVVETRAGHPLVPFRIFKIRSASSANVTMLIFAAGVVAMSFFVTLYLQQVLHYSPVQAGLSFLPMACGQIIFSNVASKLIGKLGVLRLLLLGLTFSTLGFAWFSLVSANGSFLVNVLGPAVVLSAGGGFTIVGVIVAAVSGVPEQESGLAGGLINMSQQVGGAVGLAVLSAVATWRTTAVAAGATPNAVALTDGFRLGFAVAAVLTALAGVAAWLMLRSVFRQPAPVVEPAVDQEAALPAS